MVKQPPAAEPAGGAGASTDLAEEIIYAVSHDLRGPVLNFQGFLRRLRKSWDAVCEQIDGWNLSAEQAEFWRAAGQDKIGSSVQILEQNARRMEQLLDSLLSLSRAGRDPVAWERVAVEPLVRRVAADLELLLAEKNAQVQVDSLSEVWGDRARILQVFRHVMENAVKFLQPGRPGRIRVGGYTGEEQVICRVEDNGIGIKPQDLERVFLPFGRVREIEAPGCGVGLATVRKLMQQMKGRVWAESIHQTGTTIYLAFLRGA